MKRIFFFFLISSLAILLLKSFKPVEASEIPFVKDPNVELDLNAPENSVSAIVYEGEYTPGKIDLKFKKVDDIRTYYSNQAEVVCTDLENEKFLVTELHDYPENYKNYEYRNGDLIEISDIADRRIASCQYVEGKAYIITHKIVEKSGKMIGSFQLYTLSETGELVKQKGWDAFRDNCPFCGPDYIFIDSDTIFLLVNSPEKILKLDRNFNQLAEYDAPVYKFTSNGSGNMLSSMQKTLDGKYFVSSTLSLWSYQNGTFMKEYLRSDDYDIAENVGYNANTFSHATDGVNDIFLNDYIGKLYSYKNDQFKRIDTQTRVTQHYYNGKDWFYAIYPFNYYSSDSKIFYGFDVEANKSYNLSDEFSQFDIDLPKGFEMFENVIFADGKLYTIQFGQNLDEAKDFTLSSNEGVKIVTADYYNKLGYYLGSETFEYELQNPQIPQFKKFMFHNPDSCDQTPYFKWIIDKDRDVKALYIVINGNDQLEIEDFENKKYELNEYYPGTNSAKLKAVTEDENEYYSEEIEFTLPEEFATLTRVNDDEYIPEYDDEGNLLPIKVEQNFLSLSGEIRSKCSVEVQFVNEGYFFDAKVTGDTWTWEGIELPNREYEIAIIGKCWGYQSEEKVLVKIAGDSKVQEPQWEDVAMKMPVTGDDVSNSTAGAALNNEAERSSQNNKILIIVLAAGMLTFTLASVGIVKYKEQIMSIFKK